MTIKTISRGSSTTAQLLHKGKYTSQRFESSIVLGKQSAYEELLSVWEECKTENWDCYNALPVEKKTFNNTYLFIEALPIGYSLPLVGAEPDGHLTLEWSRHPRWILSISISPAGIVHYATLMGSSRICGSEVFSGEISDNLLSLIKRVCIE